jgi:transcription initiation factor IIE alpha subunit
MSPVDLIAAVRAIDALLSLVGNAGVSAHKIIAMRQMSATGHVTEEDLAELAELARESVRKLG